METKQNNPADPLSSGPTGPKKPDVRTLVITVAFIAVTIGILGGYFLFVMSSSSVPPIISGLINRPGPSGGGGDDPVVVPPKDLKFVKFESEQDFKDYLEKAEEVGSGYYGGMAVNTMRSDVLQVDAPMAFEEQAVMGMKSTADFDGGSGGASRVSDTNVQVQGIDEPDILKTNGKELFYSGTRRYYPTMREPMPMIDVEFEDVGTSRKMMPSQQYIEPTTKVVTAFPVSKLGEIADIEETGNLLLTDDMLVVFSNNQKVYGYDVTNPANPTEEWEIEFDNRNHLVQARLYNGMIFMITSQRLEYGRPCPFQPLSVNGQGVSIRCTDIYHPVTPVQTDVTYVAMVMDPETGEIESKTSFVGASYSSIIYMSTNAIYATYIIPPDILGFMYKFLSTEATDLIPESVLAKLAKVNSYDLSSQARMIEMESILNKWQQSLDDSEKLKVENEITNRLDTYMDDHIRELGQTGIAKIDLKNFKVTANGVVPGRLLNQFSMDEYEGNLRVATTIDGGVFGSSESVSDVYVLDKKLKPLSSVQDLGKTEKIYSVRFIQDRGYVVTFRQIDPFYVIDLANPKKAELKGELKIPGYSSYLHPIAEDMILGIGKEGSKVKMSLFDVSDASNPREASKYMLEEYWSEILNTHHAFLHDDKHEVFFMPGSKGGYIFSYKGDKLQMETVVANIQAKRAIYLDDYMYIVGDDKIIVLNENDWQPVNELEFDK